MSVTDLNETAAESQTTDFSDLDKYIKVKFVELQNDGSSSFKSNDVAGSKQCAGIEDFAGSESIFKYFKGKRPLSYCPDSYQSLNINGIRSSPSSKRPGVMISWCDQSVDASCPLE